ncbi:hypothetical protein [Denitrobaculum tricleocarpae]|uniref:Uncharacterized protein n=1 Tax=Denitrobaculum tricleocarpae TaxID=2591009 RepID=A0A545TKW2_9PROT|nr:hypothetical protein [Denitrobaculum tricleocarpae]TQV77865.1 hypothetical protein FKG95_20150 [Denitrobaculum tricleocarpae]
MLKITSGGIGTYGIAAPSFELDEEKAVARPARVKLSALEVLAPRKGDEVAVVRGVVKYIGKTEVEESNYLLEEDLEPAAREGLSHLFEIDPTSDRTVKATLSVSSDSRLIPDSLCSYWETTMTVRLDLVFADKSGDEATKSYSSNAVDESCTAFWWFPQGGAIDSILDEAFQKAMEKAINDRAELTGFM